MKRLYSRLIGLPIIVKADRRKIGRAVDVVIDPDKGHLVALAALRKQVVAPIDLLPFRDGFWEVREGDVLIDPEDLIRLNTISEKRRRLLAKTVMTKSGEELGYVRDMVLEMSTLSLVQIYVVKGFLFWVTEKRLIDWKDILEITDTEIIVKDRCAKVPERVRKVVTAHS